MSWTLCCSDGKTEKRAMLHPGKPLTVRCRDRMGQLLLLRFIADTDGGYALAVEGQGVAELDGVPVRESSLCPGQKLSVGRHSFILKPSAPSPALDPRPDPAQSPHYAQPCSSCSQPFSSEDCARAWTDGSFRICLSCQAKGVRPQHLPEWCHSLNVETEELEPHQRVSNTDAIEVGDIQDVLDTDAVVRAEEASVAHRDERQRRRLSASSSASIEVPPPSEEAKGIIGKVTRVFRRRSQDNAEDERQRLQELEQRRSQLLEEAGRESLEHQGGIGLPDNFLARLSEGATLDLRLQDLNRPALEAWRQRQRQLAHCDAEIAAIRQALGLGSGPRLDIPQVTLRTEQKAAEESAFRASDALLTEDLEGASVAGGDETDVYQNQAPADSEPADRRSSSAPRLAAHRGHHRSAAARRRRR